MTKKILVVDDEPDVLEVLRVRLKSSGYEVQTAVDGEEALEMLRSGKTDLVLLDILLPGMDGCQVCREIRKDEFLRYLPVILITASVLEENIGERIAGSGADDYLIKPFDSEVLLSKIRKFIE